MTCLIAAMHASQVKCRYSIMRRGLLPNRPAQNRPYGVYVFSEDGAFDHPTWNSHAYWWRGQDNWRVAYFGPSMIDQYVINGWIFLDSVEFVTLVTGNKHAI